MTNETIAGDPAVNNGSLTHGLDPVANRQSLTSALTALPGQSFVLAVQWHPEESLADLRLFSAIVEAAQAYASGRVS